MKNFAILANVVVTFSTFVLFVCDQVIVGMDTATIMITTSTESAGGAIRREEENYNDNDQNNNDYSYNSNNNNNHENTDNDMYGLSSLFQKQAHLLLKNQYSSSKHHNRHRHHHHHLRSLATDTNDDNDASNSCIADCGPFGSCMVDKSTCKNTTSNNDESDGVDVGSMNCEYNCVCIDGFTGTDCSIPTVLCPGPILELLPQTIDRACYNGGTCVVVPGESVSEILQNAGTSSSSSSTDLSILNDLKTDSVYQCNCDHVVANENDDAGTYDVGYQCEYQSNVVSCEQGQEYNSIYSYCLNGGICRTIISIADDDTVDSATNSLHQHVPCNCPDTFEGRHCQYHFGTQPPSEYQFVTIQLAKYTQYLLDQNENVNESDINSNNNNNYNNNPTKYGDGINSIHTITGSSTGSTSRMVVISVIFIIIICVAIVVHCYRRCRQNKNIITATNNNNATGRILSRAGAKALDDYGVGDDDHHHNDIMYNNNCNNNSFNNHSQRTIQTDSCCKDNNDTTNTTNEKHNDDHDDDDDRIII